MKLIPNWKRAHRMISMQAMGAAASLQAGWMALPDGLRTSLPPQAATWIALAVLVLLAIGIGGRLIYQPAAHPEPTQ